MITTLIFGDGLLLLEHGHIVKVEEKDVEGKYVAIFPSPKALALGEAVSDQRARESEHAIWMIFKNIESIEVFEGKLQKIKELFQKDIEDGLHAISR